MEAGLVAAAAGAVVGAAVGAAAPPQLATKAAPLLTPTLGGSLPLAVMGEVLGVPIIVMPIANHDNNQHAANENLRLQNLWDGIELYAGLLLRLGDLWR